MKVSDIKPAEYNPRKITDKQLEMLKKSMLEFGDLSGFVVNTKTGNLVGGHQRLKCMPENAIIEKVKLKKKSKTGTIAEGYIVVDGERWNYREVEWDATKEKAANIAANKHGGTFEDKLVAELISELQDSGIDTDLTGFDSGEIDKLLSEFNKNDEKDNEIDVGSNDCQPTTKAGDIIMLGDHRLLCGDSSDIRDIKILLGDKKADMVFTDPPYGVDYASKNKYLNKFDKGNRIQEDILSDVNSKDAFELWGKTFENLECILNDYHSIYICSPQTRDLMMMMMMMIERGGIYISNVIIWVKNNHVLGMLDYNLKHEPIIYGWLKKKRHKFYGNGQQKFSVWNYDKPLKNDIHPTMKPVELIENAILNSSKKNDIVLDLFLGSGSTLIAAEKTGRICYGMELSPKYCDVIIDRWEKYSGKKAELKKC